MPAKVILIGIAMEFIDDLARAINFSDFFRSHQISNLNACVPLSDVPTASIKIM